jgi:N-acetylneuraminate lyase
MSQFEGILPAVVTPFDSDGRFCPGSFERLLAALYGAGVHGVYACGHTGEGLLMPVEQRMQVAEAAVRWSPAGKLVIVHVGAAKIDDAVALARHAERAGAAAVSSLPPADGRSPEEIYRYYQTLSAATNLPFLVYYYPEIYPAIGGQLTELLKLPNVIGMKFTDFNLYQLALVRRRGAVVFNGRDEILAAGLLMGANGGIGSFYNLVPELFLEVYRLGCEGRWEEARPVQMQINELIEITLHFPMIPAIKRMLAWAGLDCGVSMPAHRTLTADEERQLRAMLSQSSLAGRRFAGLRI